MQISTKFTIAVHLLVAAEYFSGKYKVTSNFLANSIGCNPVIVRNLMIQLQKAGLLEVKRGPGGARAAKPLDEITFLDIYRAVETNGDSNIFHFHEHPNPACPVGHNIHKSLDDKLAEIQHEFEEDLKRQTVGAVYEDTLKAIKAS